jgi:uncharacterized membrane protein YdfJ with MMPL/SSD domain
MVALGRRRDRRVRDVAEIIFIKELEIGIAGVLVDATVVRAFLVSSLMALLGAGTWTAAAARWLYSRAGLREE